MSEQPADVPAPTGPVVRPRRLRTTPALRRMVAETSVAARQLVTMIPVESADASQRIFEIEETRAKEELAEGRALFEREAGERVRTAWRGGRAAPPAFLVGQGRAGGYCDYGRGGSAILRDYGIDGRGEVPDDSRAVHPPAL